MTDSPESALKKLFATCKSLQLASLCADGTAHISYAPFARLDGQFLIFVSQLSRHTQNLLTEKKAAAMIIADEASSSQIFARLRASYRCDVMEVPKNDAAYAPTLDHYEAHLGKTVQLLRQLPDFVLFRLIPTSGHLVMGFGEAYEMTGTDLSEFNHVKAVN